MYHVCVQINPLCTLKRAPVSKLEARAPSKKSLFHRNQFPVVRDTQKSGSQETRGPVDMYVVASKTLNRTVRKMI